MRSDVPSVTLSNKDVMAAAEWVAKALSQQFREGKVKLYGVPRGGIPALYAVLRNLSGRFQPVDTPAAADAFIDDLIDSGATYKRYRASFPGHPFYALWDKRGNAMREWVVFPWEGNEAGSIEDSTTRLLQFIGEDPERDGLRDTPGRVARAWRDWTAGYGVDVGTVLKTFDNPEEAYNEMVVVKDLPFYSQCEHHLAAFFGTADIAYIPNGRIVGLSKLSRLLDVFARRLQVQERLTSQVADALMEHLDAKGAAVCIRARHLCMESRGIQKQGHETITSAIRGALFEDARARAEFMGLTFR